MHPFILFQSIIFEFVIVAWEAMWKDKLVLVDSQCYPCNFINSLAKRRSDLVWVGYVTKFDWNSVMLAIRGPSNRNGAATDGMTWTRSRFKTSEDWVWHHIRLERRCINNQGPIES